MPGTSRRGALRPRGSPLSPIVAAACGLAWSLAATGGCSRASDAASAPVRAIDLLHESGRASKRPLDSIFSLGEHAVGGETRRALAATAPCRIIWSVWLPPRPLLHTHVAVVPAPDQAAAVAFRFGVSDERLYDALAEQRVVVAAGEEPRWHPVEVDLSLYAGRKWSLFFRPDSHRWRLVFAADNLGGAAVVLWGSPGVDTDQKGARDWRQAAERRAHP
jgi:hypothetical protein